MIINFRYHIFTITAIFAALGLGILIGSSIIGNDGLIDKQRDIINNIRSDFNYLKKRNADLAGGISILEEELVYRESIEKKIFTILLKDYMKDDKLFLIYNNLDITKIDKFKEYLKIMGMKVDIFKKEEINQDAFIDALKDLNTFNRLAIWNMDNNAFNKCIEGINLKNMGIIEYNKGDVLGLLYNIINYTVKINHSDKTSTLQDLQGNKDNN